MVELLAPAGGIKQLKAALRFGADAVYTGMKQYGLRAYADNFTLNSLSEAVQITHRAGKRIYLTLNILPFDEDMAGLVSCAAQAHETGVDAVIVSDIGAMIALRENVPDIAIHVSTQANVLNSNTARYFHGIGARRIVLSRELDLTRIRAMHNNLPANLELEGFVHGAACIAYSGRCLISNYQTGRSSNHGECAQPCRWAYALEKGGDPDKPLPVFQDVRGTYVFSALDLNMIGHLPEMIGAGITTLKIEGRMKTEYYVATVTRAYRHALDLLMYSQDDYNAAIPAFQSELSKASHRMSNTGFYFGTPQPSAGAEGCIQDREFIASVDGLIGNDALLTVKNRFFVGDVLEALTPGSIHEWRVSGIRLRDTSEEVQSVTVAGMQVLVPVDFPVAAGDIIRGINRNHHKNKA